MDKIYDFVVSIDNSNAGEEVVFGLVDDGHGGTRTDTYMGGNIHPVAVAGVLLCCIAGKLPPHLDVKILSVLAAVAAILDSESQGRENK